MEVGVVDEGSYAASMGLQEGDQLEKAINSRGPGLKTKEVLIRNINGSLNITISITLPLPLPYLRRIFVARYTPWLAKLLEAVVKLSGVVSLGI